MDRTRSEKEEPTDSGALAKEEQRRRWIRRLRLTLVLLTFVGTIVVAKLTGLEAYLDRETVRAMMSEAGVWGFVVFLGVFAVGELLHIPGFVFVGAATVTYGQPLASLAAYSGALVSITVSFFVIRGIGGQSLAEIERPFIRRMLSRLDARPIRTVALLRCFLWVAPALNYALAMSRLRFREYFLGSALGLLLPMPLMSVFIDQLLELFG